ncbi:ABC transporter ATP-binding protein [Brevibacillus agri]|uniref:ABC transporter ATP-binding protein n=1 Tax=Brevibacillus agri TaxID=51101 RepID=UPI003D1B2B21
MNMLKIEQVTKRFGGVIANENVSFEVEEGQVLALIGPNGAGKTTCFNMIAGVFPPSEGKIFYQGQDITGKKPYELNEMGIARTFQIVKPLGKLSVFENVMVASLSKSRNSKEAQENAKEVLAFTRLESLQGVQAGQLSIGNLKRLEVARAIATKPKLLLMDEPMGGLTPSEVDEAIELIRHIRRNGTTIVIIEHIMKAVMAVSDQIVVLQNGKLIANGEPNAVMNDENVIKAYLGDGYVKSL